MKYLLLCLRDSVGVCVCVVYGGERGERYKIRYM